MKIKKLVWEYWIFGGCYAETPWGRYQCQNERGFQSNDPLLDLKEISLLFEYSLIGYFDTEAEAQDAAQKHFEDRIKSCLEE